MLQKAEHLFAELLEATEIRKVDYKRDQYRLDNDILKSRFIKDILCITNAPGGDGFILIGVKSEKGKPGQVIGVSKHYDSSDLEQIVNGVVEEPIQFDYYALTCEGLDCALIHIPPSKARPHWPKVDFGILSKRVFYTRRASGNREASRQEIRDMYIETLRVKEVAPRRIKASPHVLDELVDMSLDERKSAMYKMLRTMASKARLGKYRSIISTSPYHSEQVCALISRVLDKVTPNYAIFMYPWIAKRDDIIWSRSKLAGIIKGSTKTNIESSLLQLLEGSTLVHISYRNIYTRALESHFYHISHDWYRFANEWNEPWGRVIKWEVWVPGVRKVRAKDLTSYKKIAEYEIFMANVTSGSELQDRFQQLLSWLDNNPT